MTTAYLSAAGIGAVALTIALTFMYKKIGKKVIVYLMIIAGLGLSGAAGGLLDRGAAALARATASASTRLLGVGLPLLVAVIVGICLYPHVKFKGGQPPTRFTPWLALLFPSILAAVGLGALAAMAGSLSSTVGNSAWATITAVISGR